jgi:hypothetical protein
MSLCAPDDATTCSQRNDPPSGAVGTREFIVLGGGGQSHCLCLALDRPADQIALYADEDRAQVESGERILIDGIRGRVSQRSRSRHDSTHEPVNRAGAVHLPHRRSIQKGAGSRGIVLKPGLEALAGKTPERARKLGMADWLDQVGDVVTKEPDEDGVLVLRINPLAFVDRVTD